MKTVFVKSRKQELAKELYNLLLKEKEDIKMEMYRLELRRTELEAEKKLIIDKLNNLQKP